MAHPSDPRWKAAAETADQLYKQRYKKCHRLLNEASQLLDKHAKEQAQKTLDWGFPGDLNRVEEVLTELITFLKG